MAKRVPKAEKPYEPVKESLVRSVLNPLAKRRSAPAPEPEPKAEPLEPLPPPPERPAATAPAPVETPRRAGPPRRREKRLLLSLEEEAEIERLVGRVAAELGTTLKLSHVMRATLHLLRNGEDEIIRHARASSGLSRPPNGDHTALIQFEYRLAQLLGHALQASRPLSGQAAR